DERPTLHPLEAATFEYLVLEKRGQVRGGLVLPARLLRRQHRANDVDDQPAERDEVDPDQPVAKVVLPDGGDHERTRWGSARSVCTVGSVGCATRTAAPRRSGRLYPYRSEARGKWFPCRR